MTNEEITRLTEVEQRSKSNTRRIDKLETQTEAINALANAVNVFSTKQEGMETDVQEIKTDVKALKDVPAKRWEQVVSIIIAAVVGFGLAYIGLK